MLTEFYRKLEYANKKETKQPGGSNFRRLTIGYGLSTIIRKVLGSSVAGIVTLLSKEFLKLVLIASIFAFPLAWWAMHKCLQDFAYRTNISWWLFVLAASVALLIAFFTVSFQAIKAAK